MQSSLRSFLTGAVLVLGASVPVVLAVEAAREPVCNRDCLVEYANQYVRAMQAGNPTTLRLAPDLKVTENGQSSRMGEGFWQTARVIQSPRVFADEPAAQAVVFGMANAVGGPRRFAVRLAVDHHRIREIETLVATAGEGN